MTYLILFYALLSQLSTSVAVEPSNGYSTVLTFEEPELISTDQGSYPAFDGIPVRFSAGEPVRPSLTLYIPVPLEAEPELVFRAASYRSTGMDSGNIRTPDISGEGLNTVEIVAEPVPPSDRHVVLE